MILLCEHPASCGMRERPINTCGLACADQGRPRAAGPGAALQPDSPGPLLLRRDLEPGTAVPVQLEGRIAGKDFENLVKQFVHPQRLLRIVRDFILFTRRDDELAKVVLRPHQMRAVERALVRAADPKKRHGLVWHTQGSGKTYTMITLAKRLIEEPVFKNPTVLMLVDRTELEAQLFGNLSAAGIEHVKIAHSKEDLQRLLKADTRGLIVSMIHKFDDISANINTRKNIF